jgi:hypothetical protein
MTNRIFPTTLRRLTARVFHGTVSGTDGKVPSVLYSDMIDLDSSTSKKFSRLDCAHADQTLFAL